MLQIDLKHLPTSEELLGSDDTPVDNEDQNFVPNILLFLLEYWWKNRNDWFFAVDMGVYHTTGLNPKVPVVPDGFLSLDVERLKSSGTRKSYVVWEEQNVVPILTLEVVSQTPGGEYDEKMAIYTNLGVQYYAIYNPKFWRRDGHLPLEVYKLVDGGYQLQLGEPFWMPEVGLGIGRCVLPSDPLGREILSWFDAQGERHLTAEEKADAAQEQIEAERERANAAQRKVELLLERLRSLGISDAESL
jgi:Uma2 family endonuclease